MTITGDNEANQMTHYDDKWKYVISNMPMGGDYRLDHRQAGFDIIKNIIPNGSRVFDYAMGLGIIPIQLANEKECDVSGCDFSQVAIDYANENCEGDFRLTSDIFGSDYDYIIASQYLEHVKDPVEFTRDMLKHGKTLIAAIPNNFRKSGEHIYMAWNSTPDFEDKFSEFNPVGLDDGYPRNVPSAWHHIVYKLGE